MTRGTGTMGTRIYQDDLGEWRWRVRARNGRVVADSGEGYKRRIDCRRGAEVAADMLRIFLNDGEADS